GRGGRAAVGAGAGQRPPALRAIRGVRGVVALAGRAPHGGILAQRRRGGAGRGQRRPSRMASSVSAVPALPTWGRPLGSSENGNGLVVVVVLGGAFGFDLVLGLSFGSPGNVPALI